MSDTSGNVSPSFGPFWPVSLLALSMALFLGWQAFLGIKQYQESLRLGERQDVLKGQATEAEERLRAIMLDLLELAKADADAKAIVTKFGINFNPDPSAAPAVNPALLTDTPVAKPKPVEMSPAPEASPAKAP